MSFKKATMAAALAITMSSAPVLAQTAPASSSVTTEAARSGADMTDASEQRRRGGFIIPLLALVAVILGILAAINDGGERPTSP